MNKDDALPTLTIDPALFREDAVSEETRAANEALEAMLAKSPKLYELDINVVRDALRHGEGPLVAEPLNDKAEWRDVETNGFCVRLREFARPSPRAVYLHIHQGGYSFGGADFQDQTLRRLSDELDMTILSVEYRLAPENPWPAAPDDCEAAASWLLDNAGATFGTECLLIGGESAGACFGATTLLRLRDKRGAHGFAGASLFYGAYDNSLGPALRNWGERNLVINTKACAHFGELLWPPEDWSLEQRRCGETSPLFARLHGMPPALFVCGTFDPMIDDSMFMATRWAAAGNHAELAIYPGGVHLFDRLPIAIADEARARMRGFLNARIEKFQ